MSLFVCLCSGVRAQNPVGVLEGQITDVSGAAVSAAALTVTNNQTGFRVEQRSAGDCSFHFSLLPVGEYDLAARAPGICAVSSLGDSHQYR
ncbi:MAG: hypothetical protein DMG57_44555 [Acidobacteria bacterium]|nr:MAG: hypothetical protein DMG57_44555 [Acidobacteriota bacterium]